MPKTRSLDAVGLGMRVGGVVFLCRCPGHFELVWGWMGCGVNSNLLKVGAVALKEIGTSPAFSTKPKVQPLTLLPDFHEGIPPMSSRFVVASSCSHRQSPLPHDLPCRRRSLPSLFVFALSPISSLTSPTPDHLLSQTPCPCRCRCRHCPPPQSLVVPVSCCREVSHRRYGPWRCRVASGKCWWSYAWRRAFFEAHRALGRAHGVGVIGARDASSRGRHVLRWNGW